MTASCAIWDTLANVSATTMGGSVVWDDPHHVKFLPPNFELQQVKEWE